MADDIITEAMKDGTITASKAVHFSGPAEQLETLQQSLRNEGIESMLGQLQGKPTLLVTGADTLKLQALHPDVQYDTQDAAASVSTQNNSFVGNNSGADYEEDRVLVAPLPDISKGGAIQFLQHSTTALAAHTHEHMHSGSTFTGAVITGDGNIVTSQLGDSPAAALIYAPNTHKVEVIKLTDDSHNATNKPLQTVDGISWYEADGRINGHGLALNHALGDSRYGKAVSRTPVINQLDVSKYITAGKRVFLLVGSDGIYNERKGVTLEQHAQTLARDLQSGKVLHEVAQDIVSSSSKIRDNATASLAEVKLGSSAVVSVCDGHTGDATSQTAITKFGQIVSELQQAPDVTEFVKNLEPTSAPVLYPPTEAILDAQRQMLHDDFIHAKETARIAIEFPPLATFVTEDTWGLQSKLTGLPRTDYKVNDLGNTTTIEVRTPATQALLTQAGLQMLPPEETPQKATIRSTFGDKNTIDATTLYLTQQGIENNVNTSGNYIEVSGENIDKLRALRDGLPRGEQQGYHEQKQQQQGSKIAPDVLRKVSAIQERQLRVSSGNARIRHKD